MNTFASETNQWSEFLVPLLWEGTWQGGIALVIAWLICRCTRRIPARAQCWFWRLAFLKLLVAGLWLGPIELRWLPSEFVSSRSTTVAATTATEPAAGKLVGEEPLTQQQATAVSPSREYRQATSPSGAIRELSLESWLLIGWAFGVLFLLARLRGQCSQASRLIRDAVVVGDDEMLSRVAVHCERMNVRRPPELRVAHTVTSPCLVGLLRPIILLPPRLLELRSSDALDTAVMHELAHVKRRDLIWNWLPTLAEVLFFFHPLVWWCRRQWRLTQEIATDDLAVSLAKIDAARYAQSLVELVAACRPAKNRPQLAVAVSETYSQLNRRINAMKRRPQLNPVLRFVLAILVVATAVVGITPWRLTAQDSADVGDVRGLDSGSPAQQQAQSTVNMKKILLALHNFHSVHGHLPHVATMKNDRRLLSWRIALLPFLDQRELYEEFRHDEPWDSKHNRTLIPRMPDAFASSGLTAKDGKTGYLAIEGEGTVFPAGHPVRFRDIYDGTAHTIAVVEAKPENAVVWTKPEDLSSTDEEILDKIVGLYPAGFLAGFVDGHVKYLASDTNLEALRFLAQRADGWAISYAIPDSAEGAIGLHVAPVPPGVVADDGGDKGEGYGGATGYGAAAGGYGTAGRRGRGGYGEGEGAHGGEYWSEGGFGGYGEGGYGRGYGGEYGGYGDGYGGYGGASGGYGMPPQEGPRELRLKLTSRGTIEVLGRSVPVQKVGPILAALRKATEEGAADAGRVAIAIPTSTEFEHLRALTDLCQQHGFKRIRLIAEQQR